MSEAKLDWWHILSPYADYIRTKTGLSDPLKSLGRIIDYLEQGKIPYRCIQSSGKVVAYAILADSSVTAGRMVGNIGFVSGDEYRKERFRLLLSWLVDFSSKKGKKLYIDEPFNVPEKNTIDLMREAGFEKIDRFKMEAPLAHFSLQPDQKGITFTTVDYEDSKKLAEYEYSAFINSPDSVLFPETPDERYVFFTESLTSGSYGSLVKSASFMAFIGPEVAGAVISMDTGTEEKNKTALIRTLFVLPSFRKNGIGKLLLLKAMEALALKSYGKVWLQVNSRSLSAISLYEKTGFFRSSEPHEIFYVYLK